MGHTDILETFEQDLATLETNTDELKNKTSDIENVHFGEFISSEILAHLHL